MNPRLLFWMALTGLAGLLALMLWLTFGQTKKEEAPSTLSSDDENILKLTNTDTWEYRHDGSPGYRLRSASAFYSADQSEGRFTDLHLLVYPQDDSGALWSVKAPVGTLTRTQARQFFEQASETYTEILLSQQVLVERQQPNGTFIRIETPELYFSSATSRISSRVGVKQFIEPRDAPAITLSASAFSYEEKRGVLLYSGAVEVHRKNLTLHAETVRFDLDGEHISSLEARGVPARFVHESERESQAITGTAETILYDHEARMVELIGDASLARPRGALKAPFIRYNLSTKTATTEAAPADL